MKCLKAFSFAFFCSFFASKAVIACDASYVDLHNKLHNVSEIIFILSGYDKNEESPIHALKRFIEDGHAACTRDEVLQVLEYADWLLHNMREEIDAVQRKQLSRAIDNAADIILADILAVEDVNVDTEQTRSTVADLNVGGNISINDSISSGVGNIIKGGVRFIHNYPSAGQNNTFLGKSAGNFSITNAANSGFGTNVLSLIISGRGNTAVGTDTLRITTTGTQNTAIGFRAMESTNGDFNTAVGYSSLEFVNTSGESNVALGYRALQSNETGSFNVALGRDSMRNNQDGVKNVAVGYNTLLVNGIGEQNVAVGENALLNNIQSFGNVAIGTSAMESNVTGSENVAIGKDALKSRATGVLNVAIGSFAGSLLEQGDGNTFINGGNLVTAGDNNIMIGHPGVADDTHIIRIGTSGTLKCFIGGIFNTTVANSVPARISSTGQLGTISSSRKFKHSIERMSDESAVIFQLEPVSFAYNADETQTRQFGLIAEKVDEILPALVIRDEDGSVYTVHYEMLPVLLLNEMKKQKYAMQKCKYDLTELKQMVADLHAQVKRFVAR